ncbi:transposase, partial [Streptomyces sp. NPDC002758]
VRALGVTPVIARRGRPHGSQLGVHRWVVERTLAWLHGFRHLRIRWEHRDDIHDGFLQLAVCLILYRRACALC